MTTLRELLRWAEDNRHITPNQMVIVRERAQRWGCNLDGNLPHKTDPTPIIDTNNIHDRMSLFNKDEREVIAYCFETVREDLEGQVSDTSDKPANYGILAKTYEDLGAILKLEEELSAQS